MGAPAPTLSQLKEDAAHLRLEAKIKRSEATRALSTTARRDYARQAKRLDRAADLLDSLEEEARFRHEGDTATRLATPWTEQPTTEEESNRG